MPESKNVNLETLLEFAKKADERLDKLEGNAPKWLELTLPVSGWTNDSGDTAYPYKYVLTVDGMTASSRADLILDSASIILGVTCGFCNETETDTDSVIFKSTKVPAAELSGLLYITKETVERGS